MRCVTDFSLQCLITGRAASSEPAKLSRVGRDTWVTSLLVQVWRGQMDRRRWSGAGVWPDSSVSVHPLSSLAGAQLSRTSCWLAKREPPVRHDPHISTWHSCLHLTFTYTSESHWAITLFTWEPAKKAQLPPHSLARHLWKNVEFRYFHWRRVSDIFKYNSDGAVGWHTMGGTMTGLCCWEIVKASCETEAGFTLM